MRRIQFLAASAVALALVAPTVLAASTTATLALTGTNDWAAASLSPGVACATVTVFWNWTAPARSADFLAFWLVGRGGGFREAVSGIVWAESDRGLRVTLTTDGGTLASVGPVGSVVADVKGGRVSFGQICAGAPVLWERVGLAAPNAIDAKLKLAFSAPTTLATKGGTGAYGHSDQDFTGVRADVAATAFAGASVARDVKLDKVLPRGTINSFVSSDQVAVLESFRGTSPTAPPAGDMYGDNIALCTGAFAAGPLVTCSRLAGPSLWSALGEGDKVRAPAGTYTFRINDEVGAEPVHVVLVGAPVDWY
ncbi:MAG TPA: hypothetical protein VI997_03465 [Candidatus Thermoplasmatota archaeon]|nr:hypothetical protein [Candidatus Thermoplasmatota archaeon]